MIDFFVMVTSKILLGSKSPRRAQIFNEAGFEFQIVDIDVEELAPDQLPQEEVAAFIANLKSEAYTSALSENELLVTADTVVAINGEILGKPANAEDAWRMLKLLSSQTHLVYTGVVIKSMHQKVIFTEVTEVDFYDLSDESIQYYIHHFQPYDKAGAYGVQDFMGYYGVKGMRGCYYNVMGFPMARFFRELEAIHAAPKFSL